MKKLNLLNILSAISVLLTLTACQGLAGNNPYGHVKPDNTPAAKLLEVQVPGNVSQEIVHYYGFNINFNAQHHQPNYAAWKLLGSQTDGPVKRSNNFRPDPSVDGCATLDDYKGSGYDRGHLCPSADNRYDQRANDASFYLTNICPQHKYLNQKPWANLEEKTRKWAQRDSCLIVIAGPVLTDHLTQTIGPNQVTVPQRFFKVILSPYTNPPKAIGFIMPNTTFKGGMQQCAMSVDQVEAITGYDFFAALPDDVENQIEAHYQWKQWQ